MSQNKTDKGFSLSELVVTTGLLGAFILITSTIVLQTLSANRMLTTGKASLFSLAQAQYALTQTLSQAIQIDASGAIAGAYDFTVAGPPPVQGNILSNYDSGAIGPTATEATAAAAGNIDTLGVFLIESRKSSVSGDGAGALVNSLPTPVAGETMGPDYAYSVLEAVGIYFQRPTGTTSGVLYINRVPVSGGAQFVAAARGAPGINPNLLTQFFDRLVEVQIDEVFSVTDPVAGTTVTTGVRMTLVGRTFNSGDASQWNWCPQARMADPNCQEPNARTLGPHRDVYRTISVSFRNNKVLDDDNIPAGNLPVGDPNIVEERVLGPLYFFAFSPPGDF